MHEHVYTHKQPRLTVDLHSTNNHELNQRPTTPTPNNCRSKIFSSVIFWMASWSCLAFSTCASFCDIFGKLEFLSWRLIPVLKQKTASKTETQQNHGNRIMALHQKKNQPVSETTKQHSGHITGQWWVFKWFQENNISNHIKPLFPVRVVFEGSYRGHPTKKSHNEANRFLALKSWKMMLLNLNWLAIWGNISIPNS